MILYEITCTAWKWTKRTSPGTPTTLTCSTGWRFYKSNGRKTFHLWDDFIWNVRADTNKEKHTYTAVMHEPFVHRSLTRGVGGLASQFGIIGRCWFWQWKPKIATAWGCVDGWVAGEGMDWLIWGWGGCNFRSRWSHRLSAAWCGGFQGVFVISTKISLFANRVGIKLCQCVFVRKRSE
jgi:hypothetical protein